MKLDRNNLSSYVNYISSYFVLIHLILFSGTARGLEKFESRWDFEIANMVFHDVKVEGNTIQESWQSLLRKEFLRCILITFRSDTSIRTSPFVFEAKEAKGADLLNAFADFYGYTWTSEKTTGIIWLLPNGTPYESILPEQINVLNNFYSMPLATRILEPLFICNLPLDSVPKEKQPCLIRDFLQANTYDLPINLKKGTYTLRQLISILNAQMPSMTFYITCDANDKFCAEEILCLNISMEDFITDGVLFFWDTNAKKNDESQVVPDSKEIIRFLGSNNFNERSLAQNYLRMNDAVYSVRSAMMNATSDNDLRIRMWSTYAEINLIANNPYLCNGFLLLGLPEQDMMILQNVIHAIKQKAQGDRDLLLLSALEVLRLSRDVDAARKNIAGVAFTTEDLASVAPEIMRTLWKDERCVELFKQVLVDNQLDAAKAGILLPVPISQAFDFPWKIPGSEYDPVKCRWVKPEEGSAAQGGGR